MICFSDKQSQAIEIGDLVYNAHLQNAPRRFSEINYPETIQTCVGKIPTLEEIEKLEIGNFGKATLELKFLQEIYLSKYSKGTHRIKFDFGLLDLERQRIMLNVIIAMIAVSTEKPRSIILQNCSVLNSNKLASLFILNLRN